MVRWKNGSLILILIVTMASSVTLNSWSEDEKRVYLDAGPGQPPFDITQRSVPKKEIREGGPPKDGIPAIDSPRFVNRAEADRFLDSQDLVIGVVQNGLAKAYPVRILTWHEVVNDRFNDRPVTVSY